MGEISINVNQLQPSSAKTARKDLPKEDQITISVSTAISITTTDPKSPPKHPKTTSGSIASLERPKKSNRDITKHTVVDSKKVAKYLQEHKPAIPPRPKGWKSQLPEKPSINAQGKSSILPRPSDFLDVKKLSVDSHLESKKIEVITSSEVAVLSQKNKKLTPEQITKQKEIESKLEILSGKLQAVAEGKKLILDSEGLAIPLSSSIADASHTSGHEKEVFESIIHEITSAMDNIESFGSIDSALQLKNSFKMCIEGSWIKQALKNKNLGIEKQFESLNTGIQAAVRNAVSREVKTSLEQLEKNPIIQNALKPDAGLDQIKKAIDLLKNSQESAYGIDSLDKVLDLYASNVDVKKDISDFNASITKQITSKFLQESFNAIFIRQEGSDGKISLSQADIKELNEIIEQCDPKLCGDIFKAYSNKALYFAENGTSMNADKGLKMILLQKNIDNVIGIFLSQDSSNDLNWNTVLEALPSSILSHSALSTDGIITALKDSISNRLPLSKESEQKLADFIVQILKQNAGSSLMTRERIEAFVNIGMNVLGESGSKIVSAGDLARQKIKYALDSNGKEIVGSDEKPVLFSAFIANLNENEVKNSALNLLQSDSKQPLGSIDDLLGLVHKNSTGYKNAVVGLAQELEELQKTSLKSISSGVFAVNPKNIGTEPEILQQAEIFNRVSRFTIQTILNLGSKDEQIKASEFFLDVMQTSIDEGNYATAMAIWSAFSSMSLSALLKMDLEDSSKHALAKKYSLVFASASALFSTDSSSANLRAAIDKRISSGKLVLPPFSLYLGTHTFVFEGNSEDHEISPTKLKVIGEMNSQIEYIQGKIGNSSSSTKTDLLEKLKKIDTSKRQADLDEGIARAYEFHNNIRNSSFKELRAEYQKIVKTNRKTARFLQKNPEVEKEIITALGKAMISVRGEEKRARIAVKFEAGVRQYIEKQLKLKGSSDLSRDSIIRAGSLALCENKDISVSGKIDLLKSVYADEYNQLIMDKTFDSFYRETAGLMKDLGLQFSQDKNIIGHDQTAESIGKSLTDAYLLTSIIRPSNESLIGGHPIKELVPDEVQDKFFSHIAAPIIRNVASSPEFQRVDSFFEEAGEKPLSSSNLQKSSSFLKTSSEREIENPKELRLIDRLKYQAALCSVSKATAFLKANADLRNACKIIAETLIKNSEENGSQSTAFQRNDQKIAIYQIIQDSIRAQIESGKKVQDISSQEVFADLYSYLGESTSLSSKNRDDLMRCLIATNPIGEDSLGIIDSQTFDNKLQALCGNNQEAAAHLKSSVLFSTAQKLLDSTSKLEGGRGLAQELVNQQVALNGSIALDISINNKLSFFEKMVEEIADGAEFTKEMDALLDKMKKDQVTDGKNSVEDTHLLLSSTKLCMIVGRLAYGNTEPSVDLELLSKISSSGSELFKNSPDAGTVEKIHEEIKEENNILYGIYGEPTSQENIHKIRDVLDEFKKQIAIVAGNQDYVKNCIGFSLMPIMRKMRDSNQIIDYTRDPFSGSSSPDMLDFQRRFLYDLLQDQSSDIHLSNFGFSNKEIAAFDFDSTTLNRSTIEDFKDARDELMRGNRIIDERPAFEYMQGWADHLEKTDIEGHKKYLASHYIGEFRRKYPEEKAYRYGLPEA